MRPRLFKKLSSKVGASPGLLIHIGEKKVEQVGIDLVLYDPNFLDEKSFDSIAEALDACDQNRTAWININGLHETELIARIGEHYKIHALTLEDILNTSQRPKIEEFEHYVYIVLSMLRYDVETHRVLPEQISIILTEHALISFQESAGDVFDTVRQRLRNDHGRIRKCGCDYLAYSLLDAVVDHYFTVLEQIGTDIEVIEDLILETPQSSTLQELHNLKREIIFLRKQIWPLRDVINIMSRDTTRLINPTTTLFLRDIYDHTIQVIETIESYRDLLAVLLDLYLTSNSNKMNEAMKVLTIIATIFIPITFIAGVYGMNFRYMPELEWPWGYGLVLTLMLVTVLALLVFFKRKKWL